MVARVAAAVTVAEGSLQNRNRLHLERALLRRLAVFFKEFYEGGRFAGFPVADFGVNLTKLFVRLLLKWIAGVTAREQVATLGLDAL